MSYQPIMEIEKANIFPLFLLQESATDELKEALGKAFKEIVGVYRKGTGSFYWLEDDVTEVCGWAVKRMEDEPAFAKAVEKKIIGLCQELDKFGENLGKTNLRAMTEEELVKLYKHYCVAQRKLRGYGWIPNLADIGKETIFNKTEKRLLAEVKDRENMGAYLSLLTTPVKETINRKQEKGLLKILIAIKKSGANWQDDQTISKKIDSHLKKYGWLTYYYNGPSWNKKELLGVIRESLKTIKEPEERLKEVNNYRKSVNQKKKELLQRIRLSSKSLHLIKVIELMMFLKIYRKEFLIKSHFLMEPLMRELGERFGLSLTEARTMVPADFEKKADWKKLARERFDFCVYIARPEKSEILTGEEAQEFSKKLETKKEEVIKEELKGRCAFPGTVRGKVKIINTKEDLNKMNEGDILISRATNPDLVVAMQKAAAIVTESGGITSHAAIVSREMQKPCIVGTNIATKVLKDGDLVEVDATNGVVKRL